MLKNTSKWLSEASHLISQAEDDCPYCRGTCADMARAALAAAIGGDDE